MKWENYHELCLEGVNKDLFDIRSYYLGMYVDRLRKTMADLSTSDSTAEIRNRKYPEYNSKALMLLRLARWDEGEVVLQVFIYEIS
jgi:hypothetical protein